MELVSWNVNGIRACLDKGFADSIALLNPDIVCVQETKAQEEQVDLSSLGYYQYWNSAIKKGYSGTLILSKIKAISCTYGMGIEEHDQEGRIITLEFENFYLVNVYTPNSQRELARLDYRMQWEDAFRKYLNDLNLSKPVILCGDLNVAHQEIDIARPKTNTKSAGFTIEERNKFSELLSSGFIDTFRYFYPDKVDEYSWWSYMRQSRQKNIGWRIDYFCVSKRLKDMLVDAKIHQDIMGSDHCPVSLKINL
ncbi:exodeoxyribonuclease-3 [Bacilli bacterium PM5-3]|nr:exodeoxyribonuclease-3 [Bacilli bacterium PM5-3]MDH6603505.1 exodeoxyribonuclease-3 [Bacilli bacterium PM5-9]